jgi:hypothetical protein
MIRLTEFLGWKSLNEDALQCFLGAMKNTSSNHEPDTWGTTIHRPVLSGGGACRFWLGWKQTCHLRNFQWSAAAQEIASLQEEKETTIDIFVPSKLVVEFIRKLAPYFVLVSREHIHNAFIRKCYGIDGDFYLQARNRCNEEMIQTPPANLTMLQQLLDDNPLLQILFQNHQDLLMRMPHIHDLTLEQNFPTTLRVISCRCVLNATASTDYDALKSFISFAPSGIAKTHFSPGALNALNTKNITVSSLLRTLLHISNDIWSNNCMKHVQAVDSLDQLARQQRIDFDYDIASKWGLTETRDELRRYISDLLHQRFIKYINKGFTFNDIKFKDVYWSPVVHQILHFESVVWAPKKKASDSTCVI